MLHRSSLTVAMAWLQIPIFTTQIVHEPRHELLLLFNPRKVMLKFKIIYSISINNNILITNKLKLTIRSSAGSMHDVLV